ncbi:MAG: hypothetical protein NTU61_02755 [Candidatus Altiarchaeota archaeon]|nr:hypothetical protein [Candidatus Altiarchaeota archaeon]
MIGLASRIRDSVVSTRELIMREIAKIQKPILDRRIDEMLKEVKNARKIMVKYTGKGLGIGKRIGSKVSRGISMLKRYVRI